MTGQVISKITAGDGSTNLLAASFYGTCDTAAATAAKIVKVTDTNITALTVVTGMTFAVKFTNSNSVANPTLTIQTSGGTQILAAKSIMRYGSTAASTWAGASWRAGAIVIFVYDGTNWVETSSIDDNSNTIPATYCDTAAGTAAKVGSHTNYVLKANSYTLVTLVNANTSASALTLNINGKGAKPIYINGSASSASNYTLPAGTYPVFYDGTNYYFRTDALMTGSITGGSGSCRGNSATATALADGAYVVVSSTQPTNSNCKIWIKP